MKIEVLVFAQLRDSFGTEREIVELEDGCTAGDVAALLVERHGRPDIAALPLSYAVNEEFVAADYRLKDGDRLALLPPLSGG